MALRKALSPKKRFQILSRDNFSCVYCGRSAPDIVLEVDHVVSVYDGGTNDDDNLAAACFECNQGKSSSSCVRQLPLRSVPRIPDHIPARKPEDYYSIPIGMFDSGLFGDPQREPLSKPAAWLWLIEQMALTVDHCVWFTSQRLSGHWGWPRGRVTVFLNSLVNHRMTIMKKSHGGYMIMAIDQSHFPDAFDVDEEEFYSSYGCR